MWLELAAKIYVITQIVGIIIIIVGVPIYGWVLYKEFKKGN